MRGGAKRGESLIHRVQEVPLEDVDLDRDYDILRTLGEGCFARVFLATHRRTDTTVVLKAIHSEMTSVRDFYREFHYSYHLSPHPNILSVYSVAFHAQHFYVFAQEYAPFGDLAGNVKAGGLPEDTCKRVAQQLSSAIEFLHSKELVHRDLKLENVLVFTPDMSKIKLSDFGETRRDGTLVSRVRCTWQAFLPPEVCEKVSSERYLCRMSSDCWQLGIIIFVCLTGCPPWQAADSISDAAYCNFSRWQRRRTTKLPTQFKKFSTRLLRLFRRLLEHKSEKRASVTEVNKYLKDTWLSIKSGTSSAGTVCGTASSGCRMKESHCADEGHHLMDESKCRLKKLLGSYGLETTVDQKVISKRVWEWVLSCEAHAEPSLEGI